MERRRVPIASTWNVDPDAKIDVWRLPCFDGRSTQEAVYMQSDITVVGIHADGRGYQSIICKMYVHASATCRPPPLPTQTASDMRHGSQLDQVLRKVLVSPLSKATAGAGGFRVNLLKALAVPWFGACLGMRRCIMISRRAQNRD